MTTGQVHNMNVVSHPCAIAGWIISTNNRKLLQSTHRDLGNDPEAALADFSRAIELDPHLTDAYSARANTFGWNLGDYDAAFADFERCKELDPGQYWCYFDEGWLQAEIGDSRAAVDNFKRFLELVPEFDCPDCQEEVAIYIDENS